MLFLESTARAAPRSHAHRVEEVQASICAMLRQSPALPECIPQEYAIHDYEGFAGYEVGKYENLETAVTVAAFVAEHGELGRKLLTHGHDVSRVKKAMEEQHAGCAESLGAWVAEYIEDTGELSEIVVGWGKRSRSAEPAS